MTKVQLSFFLAKPLDEGTMSRISEAHGIYGILGIRPTPDMSGLAVEYDATRLSREDVERALLKRGIPLASRAKDPSQKEPAAPGNQA